MSGDSNSSDVFDSCLTGNSTDDAGSGDVDAIKVVSSSIISGYSADVESVGVGHDYGDDSFSNNSVNFPDAPVSPPSVKLVKEVEEAGIVRVEGDIDVSEPREEINLQDGEEVSPVQPIPNEAEETRDGPVANLRRKRTEPDGCDGKRARI